MEIQQLDQGQNNVLAWYTRLGGPKTDVTKEAYDDAVQYLRQQFAEKPDTVAWIDAQTTQTDVLAEVQRAEQDYRTKRDGQRVLPWLRKISSAIQVYGHVFDTLAQHHSEYVSLAWGGFKFILMGISNHEKLVEHFANTLEEIAFALPRAEFIAELYRTDRVKAVLSRLYANILVFLRHAIKWYARSSAGRAICAVFKPFPLQCEAIVAQIRECVKASGDEAAIASQAEVRGLHLEFRRHEQRMLEMDRKHDQRYLQSEKRLDAMDQKLSEVQVNSRVTVQQLEVESRTLLDVQSDTKEIKCRVTDVQATVGDTHTRIIQYEEVIKSMADKVTPEDMVRHISSISNRASHTRGQTRDKSDLVRRLRDWASSSTQPILVLHTGPRAQNQAREMAIKALAAFQLETASQVCWYLRASSSANRALSRVDLLRSLTFQLLRCVQANGTSMDLDISALGSLGASSSETEWLNGLEAVTQHQPQCLFVIETDSVMESGSGSDSFEFLERLVNIGRPSGCDINILVISPCDELAAVATESSDGRVVEVQWSAPAPPHLKRLAMRPRGDRPGKAGPKGRLPLK
ncbi:hypothetical protein LIA77_11041 [Sarocladium implicatum]|nr:hypothetical protein LIA77_11041 [Sarocladium implicatum]